MNPAEARLMGVRLMQDLTPKVHRGEITREDAAHVAASYINGDAGPLREFIRNTREPSRDLEKYLY